MSHRERVQPSVVGKRSLGLRVAMEPNGSVLRIRERRRWDNPQNDAVAPTVVYGSNLGEVAKQLHERVGAATLRLAMAEASLHDVQLQVVSAQEEMDLASSALRQAKDARDALARWESSGAGYGQDGWHDLVRDGSPSVDE